ncbi:hypothetical protein JXA84_04370 [candidate division WOR-3 bacterium]|nr:hypothetical protein [candidate division WOR-3 bacterium]
MKDETFVLAQFPSKLNAYRLMNFLNSELIPSSVENSDSDSLFYLVLVGKNDRNRAKKAFKKFSRIGLH